MIKYGDLVQYVKRNHINWDRDLFDVLRGFFEEYSQLQVLTPSYSTQPIQEEPAIFEHREFTASFDGEYANEDLMNLFSI